MSKRKLWSMAQNSGPLLKKYSCVFGGTHMLLSKILSCCTEIYNQSSMWSYSFPYSALLFES